MNFWDHHGALFLICAVAFPRLTILFATGLPAILGIIGWIGWMFLPRFIIAYYATLTYSTENPFLVAVAWVSAIAAFLTAGDEVRSRR